MGRAESVSHWRHLRLTRALSRSFAIDKSFRFQKFDWHQGCNRPRGVCIPWGGTLPLPTSDHRGIVPISPRGEKSSANREKPQVPTVIVRLPRGPAACGVRTGRAGHPSPQRPTARATAGRHGGRTGGHGNTPERACLGKLTSNDIKRDAMTLDETAFRMYKVDSEHVPRRG